MNQKWRNFTNGRIASFCIYFVFCIFFIGSLLVLKRESVIGCVAGSLLVAMTVAGLVGAAPGRRMKMITYIYMQGAFMTGIALATGFLYRDAGYTFFMFFLQSVVMFLFIEKLYYCIQMIVMEVSVVFLFVAGNGLQWIEPLGEKHIFGAVMLFLLSWLVLGLIHNSMDHIRHMIEKDRGLDDMTKVLEAKCYASRKAVRSKSGFLSNMSHEIRTPVNSILGMNEMILRESKEKNIRQYAKDIEGSGRVLLSIINDILDYSKIETGNLEICPQTYQFSNLVDDLIHLLNYQAEEKKLDFQYAINPEIPKSLYGDDMRLRQVLTNLLGNAIELSKKNSIFFRMTGEQRDKDNYGLHCEVVSYGSDVNESHIEKLYHGFAKYEQGFLEDLYGPELRITITAQILRRMGSELVIKMDEDRGVVFSFTVNQEVVNPIPAGEITMELNQREVERDHEKLYAPEAKVLVVDDNEMNRKMFAYLLKEPNIYVDQAESGKKCLYLLRERQYDIIFLDHMMPEPDGIETLHVIRKENANIPVVALTANVVKGAREMYEKEGFDAFLPKPVTAEELEMVLRKFLPADKIEERI